MKCFTEFCSTICIDRHEGGCGVRGRPGEVGWGMSDADTTATYPYMFWYQSTKHSVLRR